MSVGALNPNRTIALFSNAGEWVRCHRPGAGLVSTFPKTFNGGGTASDTVCSPGEGWRETIDPDDFSGGFAIWSGTSFAAPMFAAEIAAKLCATGIAARGPSCRGDPHAGRSRQLPRGDRAMIGADVTLATRAATLLPLSATATRGRWPSSSPC